MAPRRLPTMVLATACCAMACAATAATTRADLVLRNGIVDTMDEASTRAEAVAVVGERIVRVGSNAEIDAMTAPGTRVIDLAGRTVLPGLIDSHIHPLWGEFLHHRLCNVQSYTLDEGYAKLAECARTAPPGEWVGAFGWYMTDNPRIGEVTRAALDAIVPNRNVVVIARDYHTVWVNSRTLAHFGIDRNTPDPAGGRYDRDPQTGEPTGVLRDVAGLEVSAALQHASAYAATSLDLLRSSVPYLNSLGITSMLDALVDDDGEVAYHTLDAEGGLTVRASLAFAVQPETYRTEIPRIAAKRARQSPRTRVDFVKVFADGNAEDRLAALLPTAANGAAGTAGYYTQAQMDELVQLAEQNGLSVYVHAIGDGAARQVLDAIAAARAAGPCTACRHTITHLQWVAREDVSRFAALGVIANVQEGWLSPRSVGGAPGYDYVRATSAGPIGPDRAARMYDFRALHEAGARIAGSSDWFFTEERPFYTIEAGVTSRDPGVARQAPMLPTHTLDLPTLLAARTSNAAYQLFDERDVGSIEPGKLADLIVVDRDVRNVDVDAIHETRVLTTFVGGRQVFPTQ